jgi:D-alanyl-D-alanine dipeptidase
VLALAWALAACAAPAGPAIQSTRPAPTHTTATPSPTVSVDSRAPAGFVALSDVDLTILEDIRYATPHNFVGRPIDGYLEPLCILTRAGARLHVEGLRLLPSTKGSR